MFQLNISKLVGIFGGRAALAAKLKADDDLESVSIKRIDKWHERNNMPLLRLIDCMILAKKSDIIINVYDLINEKGKK